MTRNFRPGTDVLSRVTRSLKAQSVHDWNGRLPSMARSAVGLAGGFTQVDGDEDNRVVIEHVTAYAVTGQTVTTGGYTFLVDQIAGTPTGRLGFTTFAEELASGPVGNIPCDVEGYGFVAVRIPFTADATGTCSITRTRDGVTETYVTCDVDGPGVVGGKFGHFRVGDQIACTFDLDADADIDDTGDKALIEIEIWSEASPTSDLGVLLESMWVDSKVSSGATSTATLDSGQTYTLVVEGNFRQTDSALGPNADTMIYPSPGEPTNELAHGDAETGYSNTPAHVTGFLIDTGSGESHIEPVGGPYSDPTAGHIYKFRVTGEGSAVTCRRDDSVYSDNNGQLKVDIYRGTP